MLSEVAPYALAPTLILVYKGKGVLLERPSEREGAVALAIEEFELACPPSQILLTAYVGTTGHSVEISKSAFKALKDTLPIHVNIRETESSTEPVRWPAVLAPVEMLPTAEQQTAAAIPATDAVGLLPESVLSKSRRDSISNWRQTATGTPETSGSVHALHTHVSNVVLPEGPLNIKPGKPAGNTGWNWFRKANLAINIPGGKPNATTHDAVQEMVEVIDAQLPQCSKPSGAPTSHPHVQPTLHERRVSRRLEADRSTNSQHRPEPDEVNTEDGDQGTLKKTHPETLHTVEREQTQVDLTPEHGENWGPGGLTMEHEGRTYRSPPPDASAMPMPWWARGDADLSRPARPPDSLSSKNGLRPLRLVTPSRGNGSATDDEHSRCGPAQIDHERRREPGLPSRGSPIRELPRQRPREPLQPCSPLRSPARPGRTQQPLQHQRKVESVTNQRRPSAQPGHAREGGHRGGMQPSTRVRDAVSRSSRDHRRSPPNSPSISTRPPPTDFPQSPADARRFTRAAEQLDARDAPPIPTVSQGVVAGRAPQHEDHSNRHHRGGRTAATSSREEERDDHLTMPSMYISRNPASSPQDLPSSPDANSDGIEPPPPYTKLKRSGARPVNTPHARGTSRQTRERSNASEVEVPVAPAVRPSRAHDVPNRAPESSRTGAGGPFARALSAARQQMTRKTDVPMAIRAEDEDMYGPTPAHTSTRRTKRSSLTSLHDFVPATLPASESNGDRQQSRTNERRLAVRKRQSIMQRQVSMTSASTSDTWRESTIDNEAETVFIERLVVGPVELTSPNRRGSQLVMRTIPSGELVLEWKQESKVIVRLDFSDILSVQLPGPSCRFSFILLKPRTGDSILCEMDKPSVLHWSRYNLILVAGSNVDIAHLSTSQFERLVELNDW